MVGLYSKIFGAFVAMSVVVAGCSSADSSGNTEPPAEAHDSTSTQESVQPNMANCNCSSTLTCPKNGYQVEYFAVGCGYPSYSQAGTDCRNHCGGTTCKLGSWTCP